MRRAHALKGAKLGLEKVDAVTYSFAIIQGITKGLRRSRGHVLCLHYTIQCSLVLTPEKWLLLYTKYHMFFIFHCPSID